MASYLDFPYLLALSGPIGPMNAFCCCLLLTLGCIHFFPAPKQRCSAQPCLQLPLAAQEGKSEPSDTPVPSLMAVAASNSFPFLPSYLHLCNIFGCLKEREGKECGVG